MIAHYLTPHNTAQCPCPPSPPVSQVRNVITTYLERILVGQDVPGAVQYVKGVISELLMNRIDLSLLVISKVGGSVECCNGCPSLICSHNAEYRPPPSLHLRLPPSYLPRA